MRAFSRGIAEGIYGGHLPRDVAAAVALGVLLGAVTGENVSWIALLLAAILLNVHTRLFLAVWLASLLLAWLARGGLEQLGRLLLDATPLGIAIGQLGDGILIALLGWDQYAFAGGATAGSVLALAGAIAAHRLTRYLLARQCPHGPDLPPCPVAAGVPASQAPVAPAVPTATTAHDGPLVRIWIGPSQRERSLRRTLKPRRLRRLGASMAVAASLALVPACWWIAGSMARHELLRALSASNGAEVSAGDIDLSITSGDFTVRDLHVADPQRPGRDRLRVGLAKGKLSPGPLLRGRLDVERVVLSRVRTDVRRPEFSSLSTGWSDDSATVKQIRPPTSSCDIEIGASLPYWKSLGRQLRALQRLVVAVEGLAQADGAERSGDASDRGSDLGIKSPRLRLRQARVADLASCSSLGRKALLELTESTSNSALSSRPAELKVVAPKFGAELRLIFSQTGLRSRHMLECSAYDLDLVALCGAGRIGRLQVVAGRARLSGEGSLDRRSIDVRLTVEAESSAAEVSGRYPLAGVEPVLWNRGLERLREFKTDLVLSGDFGAPALGLESQLLIDQFQHHLRAAGEYALVDALNHQLARNERLEAEPAVMQTSAVEPQSNRPRPGWAEFTEEAQSEGIAAATPPAAPVVAAADEPEGPPLSYPTTSDPDDDVTLPPPNAPLAAAPTADEDAEYGASRVSLPVPPRASAPSAPPTARRLPGPVNLVVGRDPMGAIPSSFDSVGTAAPEAVSTAPRESLFSRWTSGLRQRFGSAPAKPVEELGTSGPSDEASADPRERVIPAAASEAWYNRRWR